VTHIVNGIVVEIIALNKPVWEILDLKMKTTR